MSARNINILLRLQDKFSKPLDKANGPIKRQKAQLKEATKIVNDFGKKAQDAFGKFAGAAGKMVGVGGGGLAAAFLAMDGATEEFRESMGRLNTAFDAAGMSSAAAQQSYKDFYAILGETDTATEASQLLSQLATNEQDLSTWTRIAAGVNGTFGDSLPIESLIEAANETQHTGKVVGTLADALNWAGISEDDFNAKLAACSSAAERNQLIMQTLGTTYENAADAFYKNNEALVSSRRNQILLQQVTGKLGDASSLAKNRILEMLGATAEGGVMPGSALEKILTLLDDFKLKLETMDPSQYAETVSQAFDKVAGAVKWVYDNMDVLIPIAAGLAGTFGAFRVLGTLSTLFSGFSKAMTGAKVAGNALNIVLRANPLGLIATAIGIVIGLGVALYKNWDKVKTMAEKFNDVVQRAFGAVYDKIAAVFDGIKKKVEPVFQWLEDKLGAVGDFFGAIGDFFTGKNNVTVEGHATGTPYFSGGLTRVNEGGRGEILRLPSGTEIVPHDVAKKGQNGTNITVNVTVQGNVIGNREYMEQTGSYIAQKILEAQGVT